MGFSDGGRGLAAAALGIALLAAAGPARAAVLWDGSATKGVGVFQGVECVNGMVTVADDPAYGKVWKFFFPDGDTRCEVRGSKGYDIQLDTEIYVGWRVKYDVALGTLRYVFQMKGYPPPALQSNHPVVFATEQNNLVLINYDLQDQRHTIWQSPIARNTWMTIVLRMKMSRDPAVGFIEFWFNGAKQKFSNGSERISANTFDAGRTLVKWGIYRGGQGPGDCLEYLHDPRIGTSYEDVAPSGSAPVADAGAPGGDAAATADAGGGADSADEVADAPASGDDVGVGATGGANGAGGVVGVGGSGSGGRPRAGGGASGSAGAMRAGENGGDDAPAAAAPGGCGCRIASRDPAWAGMLAALVAGAWLARRRRA
jgi:MYXO-CTERM domain-containing protein